MNNLKFEDFRLILIFSVLAFTLLMLAASWKIFTKAGKPGWASIVPVYNAVVLLEIVGKPAWWILLWLIPGVNIVVIIIVYHRLALSFGKDILFAIGMIFLPFLFFPILAFGNAQYLGPGGAVAVE
ncbi:MAG: signal peptidase I [Bacteroidetes bacterium]|nr:signal peptidase I [Bacteroidota bacterium]